MGRPIEDIKKSARSYDTPGTSKQNVLTNAIQDTTVSSVVRQQGSFAREEQTTATSYQHSYCKFQGMLEDARVMLWQAGKARAKDSTAINYLKRIITLLPHFYGEERYGWYHVGNPRGEGTISLAGISIYLSRAVEAISRGDNNSAMGIVDKARELLADLIEAERQIIEGGSK